MALIKCTKCGKSYTSQLDACPHCNYSPSAYVCPECHSLCRRTDGACKKCGMPFNHQTFMPAPAKYLLAQLEKVEKAMAVATKYEQWAALYNRLNVIGDIGNSTELKEICIKNVNRIKAENNKKREYNKLIALIDSSDSVDVLADCLNRLEQYKGNDGYEAVYNKCRVKWQEAVYNSAAYESNPSSAKELYSSIGDYRDSKDRIAAIEEEEKNKIKKKKRKKGIIAGAAVMCGAVALLIVFLVIPRTNYIQGVEAYEAGNYTLAIEKFKNASGYSNAEEYLLMSYYDYGDRLLKEKKYSEASESYISAGTYKDAAKMVNYALGMEAIENKEFDKAYSYFESAGGVRKSKRMMNACKLLEAEDLYQQGHLGEAKNAFKALPKKFKYNGISVSKRLDTLARYSSFVSLCGEWSDVDAYMEVRQTYRDDGSSHYWYSTCAADMKITCKIQKNGKVLIEGRVDFSLYTEYSSLKSIVADGRKDVGYNISETVSSLPNGLYIADYISMTVNGSRVKVTYYNNDENASRYFSYLYMTKMNFSKDLNY